MSDALVGDHEEDAMLPPSHTMLRSLRQEREFELERLGRIAELRRERRRGGRRAPRLRALLAPRSGRRPVYATRPKPA
jgi:hypothetical protein